MPRDVGQGGAEGPLSITSFLLDECICSLLKERQHVLVHFLQVLADVHGTGLDDVLGLWYANSLQLNTRLLLNCLDQHLGLRSVKSNASSASASSCRTSASMNICLSFLGRLDLNDEIDVGDVKAS